MIDKLQKSSALVLLLFTLGAAFAQAQNKLLADELKKNKITLFPIIVDIAGASDEVTDPKAVWTSLAPTDAAVQAFLKEMGLTLEDIKARPGLAKQLLATHVIEARNERPEQFFSGGRTARIVEPVGGRANDLLFKKAADGKVIVTGALGVSANIDAKYITVDDKKTIHIIDKVLYGDGYYPNFATLCRERDTVKDICNAMVYAGLDGVVDSADFAHTVLAPNNVAFTGLRLSKSNTPSTTEVADILKYHVLSGAPKELPQGIKAGSVDTLLGQPLTVKYVKVTEAGQPALEATFTSTGGTTAKVLRANVYVGKSIVNGIDKILLPKSAAAPAKAASGASPAAVKAAGRHLLSVEAMPSGGGGGEGGRYQVNSNPGAKLVVPPGYNYNAPSGPIAKAVNDVPDPDVDLRTKGTSAPEALATYKGWSGFSQMDAGDPDW